MLEDAKNRVNRLVRRSTFGFRFEATVSHHLFIHIEGYLDGTYQFLPFAHPAIPHFGRHYEMSKKFKAQASSSRAASGAFGSSPSPFAAFSKDSGLQTTSSSLSYIAEPLDLSSISQPNVVVAFKNFPKKESKTKEKALSLLKENLFGPQSGSHALEDSILEAWVCSPAQLL